MAVDERSPQVVLLEPNPAVQARIARILCAAAGLGTVKVAEDVMEMADALGPSVRALLAPDVEVDLATSLVSQQRNINLAIVCQEITLKLLELMADTPQFNHLVSWPDFLPIPRSWDLMAVARCVNNANGCNWREILPGSAASVKWRLYSSFDRDSVIEQLTELIRDNLNGERNADTIAEVAYEMAMNAMYDAPVDEHGQLKYSFDRQQDIALEDHEVPTLTFATDGTLIVLEIEDPFGGLTRQHVLEGLHRGLAAKTTSESKDVLNTQQGGAGLGLFRMFQLATSLCFDVEAGLRTRVVAVFDLGLRTRDRRAFPTSLHLNFR